MFKKFPAWWAAIKALIFGVDPQAAIVLQQGEDAARLHLKHAITFVETLKQLVHNPFFDFLSQITPLGWDDAFLHRSRQAIAATLRSLKLIEQEINTDIHPIPAIATTNLVSDVAHVIEQLDETTRHAFYAELAARLASDNVTRKPNKLAREEVETYYHAEFKPTLEAAKEPVVAPNSIFYNADNQNA